MKATWHLLAAQGTDAFAEALRQERSQALQAQPYQHSETRLRHPHGFKDKTLTALLAVNGEDGESGNNYLNLNSTTQPSV
jgi:hypothetical protein